MSTAGRIEIVKDLETLSVQAAELIADQVEAAWGVVEPVLRGWADSAPRHFPNYSAGGEGPSAAADLLARDGRSWRAVK